jgi:hypothetical protein
MPDVFEILNTDYEHRILPNLQVVHTDGSVDVIPAGRVVLQAGANVEFVVDDDRDEITLNVQPGVGNEDPYLTQKLAAFASLSDANTGGNPITGPFPDPNTNITPDGPAWSFTRESMWIGAMNNAQAEPITGAFFLVNDSCADVGEFPNNGFPDQAPSTLKILDICTPCIDCLQFVRISDYLSRISDFYTYILNLVLAENAEPEHPDGGTPQDFYGLLPQWLATRRYWDYLVHNSTIKLVAQSMGQSLTAAVFYRNISSNTVPQVTIEMEFEFLRDTGSGFVPVALNLTPDTVEVRELVREGETDPASLSGAPVYTSTTITATFESPGTLAPNIQTFADMALLFRDMGLIDNSIYRFAVRVTASVSPTHLSVSPITKETLVFFVPPSASSSSSS